MISFYWYIMQTRHLSRLSENVLVNKLLGPFTVLKTPYKKSASQQENLRTRLDLQDQLQNLFS